MKKQIAIALMLGLGWMAQASADERPSHAKGLPAETTEQAVANLAEYNQKLAAVLAQQPLTLTALEEAHILSYTLEVALEKLSDDLEEAADLLEKMHVASERAQEADVLKYGNEYLAITQKIAK